MAEVEKAGRESEQLAKYLERETGITPEQAHDLISMLGMDRPSLLREARETAKRRTGRT